MDGDTDCHSRCAHRLRNDGGRGTAAAAFERSAAAGRLITEEEMSNGGERYFRVISTQVRFGCGYRTVDGEKQFFAWHGYPSRNDDFFTTAEISRAEFEQIATEYPKELTADRDTAQVFRDKYVEGHRVLLEGWNQLL